MHFIQKHRALLIAAIVINSFLLTAQISPGDLAEPHAHLEGLSNCTKCHTLGEKVSNEKCLDCHTELKSRIDQQKGYHSSAEVKGKECVKCHNDHHGRNFEMIRFDTDKFDHSLTGYDLLGAHGKQECKKCHKSEFIADQNIRKKEYTYLGLNTSCLSCHDDYHQKTLAADCASCHDFEAFKPAVKFDHNKAKYKLLGKHTEVECSKCHKIEDQSGKKYQQFTGLEFTNCANCHEDVHKNKFGQNCIQCHSEESFHIIKGLNNFDHSKTDYPLEGKHQFVDCNKCHKTNYTDPIYTKLCTNCHADYHKQQFVKQNASPDCADCHSVNGFQESTFTIEKHNVGSFPLNGAHLATPCFACHKKEARWEFKEIGLRCIDCHENIHEPYLDKKYYPEATCASCHGESRWSDIQFDHSKTKFALEGAHQKQTCRSCHFKKDELGTVHQQFSGLSSACANCHRDIHGNQFEENGIIDCIRCHDFNNWKASKFDHNSAKFKLDGAHQNVACAACHKPVVTTEPNYILYKIKDFRCEDCHK